MKDRCPFKREDAPEDRDEHTAEKIFWVPPAFEERRATVLAQWGKDAARRTVRS